MSIPKAFLATVLFLLFVELTGSWVLLGSSFNLELWYQDYYLLINGLIEIVFVALFINQIQAKQSLMPKRTEHTYYLIAVMLGVLFVLIQTPLNLVYNSTFDTSFYFNFSLNLNAILSWNALSEIILIAIAEELFFKQYLQKELFERYGGLISIITTALLFSFIHLNFVGLFVEAVAFTPHWAYITFFGGLISAILYHKSKSIGPSIVFHSFWNMFIILF